MNHTTVKRGLLAAAIPVVGLFAYANIASADDTLTASLKGRNEVATGASNNRIVGDPNGRGTATVSGTDDPTELCYSISVKRIEPATAAHIHEGVAGTNGPVVVTLAAPTDGTSSGCVTASEGLVAEILAVPAEYYVNVHNPEYPGGAVRGQLS